MPDSGEYFGSDDTIRALRRAYGFEQADGTPSSTLELFTEAAAQSRKAQRDLLRERAFALVDVETAADILLPHVRNILLSLLCGPSASAPLSDEQRRHLRNPVYRNDVTMNCLFKVQNDLPGFLMKPENDPDDATRDIHYTPRQKGTWLEQTVASGLMDYLPNLPIAGESVPGESFEEPEEEALSEGKTRRRRRIPTISLDAPRSDSDDSGNGDFIPDPALSTEERLCIGDSLEEAMDRLFLLKNETSTLAVVTFVIFCQELDSRVRDEVLAQRLNGMRVQEVRNATQWLLRRNGIHPDCLRGLDRRIDAEDCGDEIISGLTAEKLQNRKNAIRKSLQKQGR